MKDFIVQNWKYIAVCVVGFINLIILLLKKNKVIVKDNIFTLILEKLPQLINSVELEKYTGTMKKDLVVVATMQLIIELTGDSYEVVYKKYHDRVDNAIEAILSTPQKKGSEKDEKNTL